MTLILGKDGVNKTLTSAYVGIGGVNKKQNEMYLGMGGVNRQVLNNSISIDTVNIDQKVSFSSMFIIPKTIEFDTQFTSYNPDKSSMYYINFASDSAPNTLIQISFVYRWFVDDNECDFAVYATFGNVSTQVYYFYGRASLYTFNNNIKIVINSTTTCTVYLNDTFSKNITFDPTYIPIDYCMAKRTNTYVNVTFKNIKITA